MASFTVPYFSLTKEMPAADLSPRIPAGIFGSVTAGREPRYIREEKFTFAYTREGVDGPSLVATFGSLISHRQDQRAAENMAWWVSNNLRSIWLKWDQVLDFLEEQTS